MAWNRLPLLQPCALLAGLGALTVGPTLTELPRLAQEAAEGPVARVTTLANYEAKEPPLRQLVDWGAAGPIQKDGTAIEDWVQVHFPLAEPLRERAKGPIWTVHLVDGSRLRGRPLGGDPDRLDLVWGIGADQLVIPIDLLAVRGMGKPRLPVLVEEQEEDVVELATPNGRDLRRGWLEEMGKDGLRFSVGDRVEEHSWERIESLALLAEEAAEALPGQVRLRLVDGSDLPFVPEKMEEREWLGRLPWGGRLRVPLHRIVAVDRMSGPFKALHEIESMQAEYPQARVLDWSPRRNVNLHGAPIQIGDTTYPLGIAVRAPTTLRFPRVQAGVLTIGVGVDDLVRSHREPQPLVFEVLLDGQRIGETVRCSNDDGLVPLRLLLPHAGELTLRCTSAGDEDASGRHGAWVAPRLWALPADGA